MWVLGTQCNEEGLSHCYAEQAYHVRSDRLVFMVAGFIVRQRKTSFITLNSEDLKGMMNLDIQMQQSEIWDV